MKFFKLCHGIITLSFKSLRRTKKRIFPSMLAFSIGAFLISLTFSTGHNLRHTKVELNEEGVFKLLAENTDRQIAAEESVLVEESKVKYFEEIMLCLGLVMLLVGGLSFKSIMHLNFELKSTEIALSNAIGFSKNVIFLQYFFEFGLMSFLAGLVGSFTGMGLGYYLGFEVFLVDYLHWEGFLIALGATILMALFWGLMPIRYALKLNLLRMLKDS